MGDLTRNFSIKEFACKDGSVVLKNYQSNVKKLATNLQVLRDHIGQRIHVNSGYRTPSYNKKVGGASQSQHLYAKAVDIRAQTKTPKKLHSIIEKLISGGKMAQGGLGLYSTFVHYDVRGYKARWQK